MADVNWQRTLAALRLGQDLTWDQSRDAMTALMSGDTPEDVIEDFLLALRAKSETTDEIGGLLAGLIEASVAVDVPGPVADVVGTGGDGLHTVNISTMAAIVVAATGTPVVKHGNRAATSKCGSADVLEALGITIALSPAGVAECVAQANIGFCFAPAYHPAMRHVGPVRRRLGVPTVFNVLGPLANPASARLMLVGCADAGKQSLLSQVLAARGVTAAVVRADDGMDEVSISAPTLAVLDGGFLTIEPTRLGVAPAEAVTLAGGDADENAEVVRDVFAGRRNSRLDAVRDCVMLNAAATLSVTGLREAASAGGTAHDRAAAAEVALRAGMETAQHALMSGAASRTLQRWVEVSRSVS